MSEERYKIVLDEVHNKDNLVYDKHKGALVGFVNLGEVNNHLMKFEVEASGEEEKLQQLTTSMVVIMV